MISKHSFLTLLNQPISMSFFNFKRKIFNNLFSIEFQFELFDFLDLSWGQFFFENFFSNIFLNEFLIFDNADIFVWQVALGIERRESRADIR